MATDKIRKYVLPNIPYLFIGWFCLKIGTAYRLAAGAGFGEKLLGLGQTIGAAFADFAPGPVPFDWLVGVVGALAFRLLIYCKAKKAKKFRRDQALKKASEQNRSNGIAFANQICKEYRREGRFFDEILDGAKQRR